MIVMSSLHKSEKELWLKVQESNLPYNTVYSKDINDRNFKISRF